jgi:DNA-binding NarL/FixJ family response regulator
MTEDVIERLDCIQHQLQQLVAIRLQIAAPSTEVELWSPMLSPRERELLTYLAAGLSSQEIADHLIISERTVREHIANMLSKMMLPNRQTLSTWAMLGGLVAVDDVVALWRRYRNHLVIEAADVR